MLEIIHTLGLYEKSFLKLFCVTCKQLQCRDLPVINVTTPMTTTTMTKPKLVLGHCYSGTTLQSIITRDTPQPHTDLLPKSLPANQKPEEHLPMVENRLRTCMSLHDVTGRAEIEDRTHRTRSPMSRMCSYQLMITRTYRFLVTIPKFAIPMTK